MPSHSPPSSYATAAAFSFKRIPLYFTDAASFWSWTAIRRSPPPTPAWVNSFRVCRVSSHAITSAARSASTARGAKSPRLPIGVATSVNRPIPCEMSAVTVL